MRSDRFILASASPRRRELLRALIADFSVRACPLDEPRDRPAAVPPRAWAEAVAYFKARAVAEQYPDHWVLGADTIVTCGNEVLGKPRDRDDARRMLCLQAGRPSEVITGVCLLRVGEAACRDCRAEVTRVWMRAAPAEIETYLYSGDWHGKAGAYGLQTAGDRLVSRIEGSFSNVVGLPVELVRRMLARAPALARQLILEPSASNAGTDFTGPGMAR